MVNECLPIAVENSSAAFSGTRTRSLRDLLSHGFRPPSSRFWQKQTGRMGICGHRGVCVTRLHRVPVSQLQCSLATRRNQHLSGRVLPPLVILALMVRAILLRHIANYPCTGRSRYVLSAQSLSFQLQALRF